MASAFPQSRGARGRAQTSMTRCRDCRAAMLWATTPRGARLPLDVEPADPNRGKRTYLVLERERDWRLAVEIADPEIAGEVLHLGMGLRTCHFDTCTHRRTAPRERADLA